MPTKRLYRSCKDQVLGGVAGGLAEYLDVDSTIVRLIFLLMLFSGFALAAYIIAWVIIPLDPACDTKETGAQEIKNKAEGFVKDLQTKGQRQHDMRLLLGVILFGLGLLFISENFGIRLWHIFWPVVLIIFGVYLVSSK